MLLGDSFTSSAEPIRYFRLASALCLPSTDVCNDLGARALIADANCMAALPCQPTHISGATMMKLKALGHIPQYGNPQTGTASREINNLAFNRRT